MKQLKWLTILTLTLFILSACGGTDGNENANNDTNINSNEDDLTSALDIFSLEDVKIPFIEVSERSDGRLNPLTAGYFENGKYIVDVTHGYGLDDFQKMNLSEVTAEIDSVVSEINNPMKYKSDYMVEPYYESLHIFKYTSPTDDSESLQIPIFFRMPGELYGPADMNEAQLDNFARTEYDKWFLTNKPTSSVDIKLIGKGKNTGRYKLPAVYATAFSINDPVQFIEDTTRSEREKLFPVYKSVNTSKYESWVELVADADGGSRSIFTGSRSILIYKTPEVIELLGLDEGPGLIPLTNKKDDKKPYVYETAE